MITIIPLRTANDLVASWHRHAKPVIGHKWSIGLYLDGRLVGAAIVGRPVSRVLAARGYLEVTRLVTDGTPNACSRLYAAAWRKARKLGYRLCTYTRADEGGGSLRGAGWTVAGKRAAGQWNTPARPRQLRNAVERIRWEPPA